MKKIITSIALVSLVSCNETKENESNNKCIDYASNAIEQANWFLGTWQNITPDGVFTERWEQKNDSLYLGNSTVVVGKDTVFFEKINLQKTNSEWNYIVSIGKASITLSTGSDSVTASASNNEKPVAFKLISLTSTQLVFENPQHDFPTKIIYTQINNDSIVAEISGIVKGIEKKELFPMKKIK